MNRKAVLVARLGYFHLYMYLWLGLIAVKCFLSKHCKISLSVVVWREEILATVSDSFVSTTPLKA